MQHEFNFEGHGDLSGQIAVKLANNQNLDEFCMQYIADYNKDRFEAFAIRVLLGKETVITIYAVDKIRQEGTAFGKEKIPVKKFKLDTLPLQSLFAYCESFNFTLTTGNYQLEDMQIINK
jgi:hypothetical protein